MRVQPYKEDLDRLIELIDEFDTVLVANLLIAYGYAKWNKSHDSSQQETSDNTIKSDKNLETSEEE
jgi:restriction endonuclease Mrr